MEPDTIHFVNEQFRHCKAIGSDKEAMVFMEKTYCGTSPGMVINGNIDQFLNDMATHRFWQRETQRFDVFNDTGCCFRRYGHKDSYLHSS